MLVIQVFCEVGYEIVIDDFGIGYLNLYNLYVLNVDIFKIDKIFVDMFIINNISYLIVEYIIEMVCGLWLKMIVEGVEMLEQVSWFYKCGVQYCQGWLFVKVMLVWEFMQWLVNVFVFVNVFQLLCYVEI